jgi:DNA-binding response OmpR family regulator
MPSPIYIVDSSPAVRRLVEQISTPEGFEVVGFQDGPAALEAAKRNSPTLIIADYNLQNMTFSGFCKEINKLDHLTETYLISLINPSDHPDETHLRSLGVKAFLNKPFQSDTLIEIIRSLHHKQQQAPTGMGFKRRAWPPTVDSEDAGDSPNQQSTGLDRQKEQTVDRPVISPQLASAARPASASPQDAMKGLFDQLLQSVAKETEKKLADMLPRAIEEKLANHVQPIIQKELRTQLGEVLSAEQLATIIRPLLSRELPSLLGKEIANCEPIIRQAASDVAGTLVKEKLEHWVQEQAEASIQKQLPDLIREHVGSIDQIVKDEVRAAAAKQAPLIVDDIVRTAAQHTVERAVQHVVPELAEQHIKAELKRLTASN